MILNTQDMPGVWRFYLIVWAVLQVMIEFIIVVCICLSYGNYSIPSCVVSFLAFVTCCFLQMCLLRNKCILFNLHISTTHLSYCS